MPGQTMVRPSRWRHPIRRFRWWRRYGSAPGIITMRITLDSDGAERALRDADQRLRELDR